MRFHRKIKLHMKEKLNGIKNLVYEVEGLLELAQLRADKLSDLLPLMRTRIDAVSKQLHELGSEDVVSEEIHAAEDDSMEADPGEQAEDNTPEVIVEKMEEADKVSITDAQPAATSVSEENMSVTEPDMVKPKSDRPLFCLNDRFKFRRMIFGGSDADFNAAIEKLSSLGTYEDAEDYFFNDLGLDAESAEVQEFMTIIKSHYGQ